MANTAINRAEELSNISGIGKFWMAKLEDKPFNGLLDAESIPSITGSTITGNFDLLGKMTMDSVEFNGDDQEVNKIRYTDGSVGITLVQDGTFGISCSNMNIAPELCMYLLNMDKTGPTTGTREDNGTFGAGLAYGLDDKMGFVSPAAVYMEFQDSVEYKGLLIPYATVSSKLNPTGNKTDIWSINININSNECPAKYKGTAYTSLYVGASYILIPKKTWGKEQAGS